MRLVCSEFVKLFSNRLFIICFALFFVINAAGFYFFTTSDETYKYELSLSDELENKLSYYLDMDRDDAAAELSELKEAYSIASNIQSASSENIDPTYVTALIEQYKSENPKAYERAQQLIEEGFSSGDVYVTDLLYEKFSYIDEYNTFINDMQSRTDSQLQFSIFSKPGTFAYNNIEKTPPDFEHLKGVEITPGFDLGINLSTTFVLTDYLLLILVLLVCIALFSLEREKGLTALVKSTQKGRHHTMAAKLVVTLLTVAGVTLVFYISNLLTGGVAFGLGDLNRSIQSIPEFMNCTLKCTVLQYLVLWVLKKAFTLCAVALILALVFTLIKSTNITYIVLVAFFGAEFCMYNFIDSMSPVNHFKYINVFYFLSGNELFGKYLNLNFFTHPVNVVWIYLLFLVLCALIIPPLCSIAFSKQGQFAGANVFANLSEKIRLRIHTFRGSTSVFKGECYKHYVSSKVVIVLVLVAGFAFANFTENININYSLGADVAYAAYLNRLEGELTPEKEQFLEDEQKYFDELNAEKEAVTYDTTLTEDQKSAQITAINNILDTRGKGFETVMLQYDTIKAVGEKLNITPYFINYTVGKRLMADASREWNLFALFMVLIVFTLSGIFAYEYKRNMKRLICAAQKGKGRLVAAKFAVAMLTYSVMYVLIYLPYIINFIKTFGTDIFSEPLVFLEGFERLESSITIMQAILLEGLLHITISLAAAGVILLLSNKLKNTVTTMIVSTAVTLIPCVLIYFNRDLRIFSLLMNNKLWVMALLIGVSTILAVIFAGFTYKNFTGKSLRRRRNGT